MFLQFLLAFLHTTVRIHVQQNDIHIDDQVAQAPSNQIFANQF